MARTDCVPRGWICPVNLIYTIHPQLNHPQAITDPDDLKQAYEKKRDKRMAVVMTKTKMKLTGE